MSSADAPRTSSTYLRWLLGRKRVIVVDDVREQLTLAADIIDELAEKNQKLADAYEKVLNRDAFSEDD